MELKSAMEKDRNEIQSRDKEYPDCLTQYSVLITAFSLTLFTTPLFNSHPNIFNVTFHYATEKYSEKEQVKDNKNSSISYYSYITGTVLRQK